ncbi:hypothetical protein [Azospira inquinata]|uniref:Uncharacterized protein n=1 Tax=Azospira inquinata TaxID=2785627 RepID=A0A975SNZ5_9RHOO|nr:hypothetical protein [Azospira inquinata]QWT45381.1 hypothetical protein J8L76_10555 [Azospira inquinata]QWT49289.1 hypothetical protein Azoinq_01325 [Azospira inquinata]
MLFKKIFCFPFSVFLFLTSQTLLAQELIPPEQINLSGRVFNLAYKSATKNGRAIYEYTANGENIENWITLVTLNYAKDVNVTPEKWVKSVGISLEATKPKPHYKLYLKADHGFARFIFEPDPNNPTYESNVHKSFHMGTCGTVVFQYASKHPMGEDPANSGTLLKTINTENEKMAADLEQSDWKPTCN